MVGALIQGSAGHASSTLSRRRPRRFQECTQTVNVFSSHGDALRTGACGSLCTVPCSSAPPRRLAARAGEASCALAPVQAAHRGSC